MVERATSTSTVESTFHEHNTVSARKKTLGVALKCIREIRISEHLCCHSTEEMHSIKNILQKPGGVSSCKVDEY